MPKPLSKIFEEQIPNENPGSIINPYSNRRAALLSSTARIDAPFIRVDIAGFVIGVKQSDLRLKNASGVALKNYYRYPNYVQSLEVNKINGTVDEYTIQIKYPITFDSDPNMFEKVFSNISQTRRISIQYGDSLQPDYIYKSTDAIVSEISTNVNLDDGSINYTVKAISSNFYGLSNCISKNSIFAKPSTVIKELIRDNSNGLLNIFTGMRGKDIDELSEFIDTDDRAVTIPSCTSISILDYIGTLVSYMVPNGSPLQSTDRAVYTLSTFDDSDGKYGGPYFKVKKIENSTITLNGLCDYTVDIGFPSANIVTNFSINDTENWSLLYNYGMSADTSKYVTQINDDGSEEKVYWPMLTGTSRNISANETTWWSKVTQFPISASITLKGLLRPSILMTYVKLNVYFYGHKHVSSGYYLITSHVDRVDSSGYMTTLGLLRVGEDEELV